MSGSATAPMRGASPLAAAAALMVALLTILAVAGAGQRPSAGGPAGESIDATRSYAKLPLAFEPNAGRMEEGIDFIARAGKGSALLSSSGARLVLANETQAQAVDLRLVDAETVKPRALDGLPGRVNDLRGDDPARWVRGIPTFGRVRYPGVYPGIDLEWHGTHRALEYDFRLGAGAHPDEIALRVGGAERLELAPNGDLLLRVGAERLHQAAPVAYQLDGGQRSGVEVDFKLRGKTVSFALGAYDHSRPLVIDPVVLDYSTYLGGNGADEASGIAVDGSGAAYITGRTLSTDFDTAGSVETDEAQSDVFVSKLNPAGNAIAYSTYLGGNDEDRGSGIALDAAGAAYVVGTTRSTDFNTVNQLMGDPGDGRQTDAFVSKLTPAGDELAYSTYLGSNRGGVSEGVGAADEGVAIAVDATGSAYVTGNSDGVDNATNGPGYFPTVNRIEGATGEFEQSTGHSSQASELSDAFVAKLNAAGNELVYSTFLGGNRGETGTGIAVDSAGFAYVTGSTSSTDFNTFGGIEGDSAGFDVFVSKLAPDGGTLSYSTYLGGDDFDAAYGIAVDSSGSAYVAGTTSSSDFDGVDPIEGDAVGPDGFVAKLNEDGNALVYSTYLGGGGTDVARGIAVDTAGAAYVTGRTDSTDFNRAGALEGDSAGADAFVASLGPGGALSCATYLGGGGSESGNAIAVGQPGSAYVAGLTESDDLDSQGQLEGDSASSDAFVSKLSLAGECDPAPAAPSATPQTALRAYVIVLDGLRPGEITPDLTPSLDQLKQEGTWYEQARSVYIAETLPNHAAMMTGTLPARNGIVANDYFQKGLDNPAVKFRLQDQRVMGSKTLTTSLEERCDVSTATVMSKSYLYRLFSGEPPDPTDPSLERIADHHWNPTLSGAYINKPDEHTPDQAVMQEGFMPWLRSNEPLPQFAFLNLGDIDRAGHVDESGPITEGGLTAFRQAALTDTDTLIGSLVEELKTTGAWEESVLIFASDHGMDWSRPDHVLTPTGGKLIINGAAGMVYTAPGADIAAVAAANAALPGAEIVATRQPVAGFPTLQEMGMDHPHAADVVVFAEPGWRVAETVANDSNPIPGNHGSAVTQHSTLFVAGGHPALDETPQSVSGTTVYDPSDHAFLPPDEGPGNLSIAPTIAKLFGLEPPEGGYDGEPLNAAFDDWAFGPHTPCGAARTPVELSISDVTVSEGNSGETNANFTVALASASEDPVEVRYRTRDGSATAPSDYVSQGPTTLSFDPGQTEKTVSVPVKGDGVDEPDETFTVELADELNAELAKATGTATITDDEPTPRISIDDRGVSEGDSGTNNANFTVSISGASQSAITVDYATADGTATPPADYDSQAGTLTFSPLETTPKAVAVAVKGDTADEPNETFFLDLSNAANATIAKSRGTGTILDDDGPPDGDGDLVPDGTDQCSDEAGPPANGGCPVPEPKDTDGDGVLDQSDFCPNQPGPAANAGCPLPQAPEPPQSPQVPQGSADDCTDQMLGTAGKDTLTGTGGGDRLFGLLGADQLFGVDGPDCIFGGPGEDLLAGDAGADLVRGGEGGDRVQGGADNDVISGGPGPDHLSGGPGDDWIRASDASGDRVRCGAGRDAANVGAEDVVSQSCEQVRTR